MASGTLGSSNVSYRSSTVAASRRGQCCSLGFHQTSHWVDGSRTRHTRSHERRNDSCGSSAVVETPLHEAQVPGIVRRAYALAVERSPHNLPMSPMELVVVADLRRFVETTTGPPVRSRFSQMEAVGSESVGCLVPTV